MWIWIGWGLCGILAFAIMWRGWGICFNGRYQVAKLIESVGCFVLGPIGEIVALVMVGKYCFRKKERLHLPCFQKGKTKMEKIYWDESQQQILTKDGKCLYDPRAERNTFNSIVATLTERVYRLENAQYTKRLYDKNWDKIEKLKTQMPKIEPELISAIGKLERQLQCSAKTQGKHKMVYQSDPPKPKNDTNWDIIGDSWNTGNACTIKAKRYIFKCSICDLEITKTKKELSAVEKEALKKLKLL